MNKEDAIWLACAVDGEGWISCYPYSKEKRWPIVEVGVCNSCKEFVQKAAILMGTKVRKSCRHGGLGSKPIYKCGRKGHEKVKQILDEILPFLIVKKDKALETIKFIDGREWGVLAKQARINKSNAIKISWQNPEIRRKRLEGMKKR